MGERQQEFFVSRRPHLGFTRGVQHFQANQNGLSRQLHKTEPWLRPPNGSYPLKGCIFELVRPS